MEKKLNFSLFGEKYHVHVEDGNFAHSFSKNRANTLHVLEDILEKAKIDTLIAIDGKDFTSNVEVYEAPNLQEGVIFLEPGIDGVVVNDICNTRKKIGIILGIADCGGVVGGTKDGNTMFNIHAGYKGVFGGENNHGIIAQVAKELEKLDIDTAEIAGFLAPMAGKDFELPKEFVEKISAHFFEYYPFLKFGNYFQENGKKDEHGGLKGALNLRKLIHNAFQEHGIENIHTLQMDTTNPHNSWSSFRLFSNKIQEKDSRLSVTIKNHPFA